MKFCKKLIKTYPEFDIEMYFVFEYSVNQEFDEWLSVTGYPFEHPSYLLAMETEDDGRFKNEIEEILKRVEQTIPSQLKFIKEENYGVGFMSKLNDD